MALITDKILLAMVRQRALTPGKDDKTFVINFKIVQQQFPSYLEFLVKSSLNTLEQWAYTNGYMAYIVRDDGMLEWRATGKDML